MKKIFLSLPLLLLSAQNSLAQDPYSNNNNYIEKSDEERLKNSAQRERDFEEKKRNYFSSERPESENKYSGQRPRFDERNNDPKYSDSKENERDNGSKDNRFRDDFRPQNSESKDFRPQDSRSEDYNSSGHPNAGRPPFENLSSEKKELLKKEMETHRQNVKNIAGIEIVFGEEERNLGAEANKQRAEKNRQIAENLSENSKIQLKQEFERHREQMKSITGVDIAKNNPNNGGPENRGFDKNFMQKRCQEPSPQDMQKHRQAMESLPQEKRELVKKEMDRHRQEMKNITGLDMPTPKCE